jgi:GTP cyclohydrolase I
MMSQYPEMNINLRDWYIPPPPPKKEQMSNNTSNNTPSISETITERMVNKGHRFWASDNVSDFIYDDEEKQALIDEATAKFEAVLDSLLIDRHNDPNSRDTGRRMAKMYINELFEGRFTPPPKITAFPNDDVETRFAGMLIATAELKSMCSHHHAPVTGKAWIGILPSTKVIGLSKYARLAQWYARRGTLQEELTKQIADGIQKHTGSQDLAVVVVAEHGCCTNRGIMANDSSTWTSVLRGQFFNPSVKQEFFNLIQGGLNKFQCN